MKNYRKFLLYLFAVLTVFFWSNFVNSQIVLAGVSITEIMYDLDTGSDTGREWVEVYNDGEAVNFTEYKLFEASTNHGITESAGGSNLNSSEYAVIADNPDKFKIDYPSYSGKLFDSTFSLSNTGETLVIKNKDLNIIDSVTYNSEQGANGDGGSLQKISGTWVGAVPTPGAVNSNNSVPTDDTGGDTGTTTATSTATTTATSTNTVTSGGSSSIVSVHYIEEYLSNYVEPASSFEVSAGRERLSYVGSPVLFEAKYKTSADLKNRVPSFIWSFGDGASATAEEIIHTYKYPGEYNVVLNASLGVLNSVTRTKVKVLVPNLLLSVTSDGAVEVTNKSAYEINLYNWKIKSGSQFYAFPIDTIISASKSIVIPGEYLKIPIIGNEIILTDISGKILAQANQKLVVSNTIEGERVITLADVERFASQYKTLVKTEAPVYAAYSPVPKANIPLTASVASAVIDNTSQDEQPEVVSKTASTEPEERGFWSKFFHPIRTIQETFYN